MSDLNQFPVLLPTLQIGFYDRLRAAQQTHLLPALLAQVGALDIGLLDDDLLRYAGREKLAFMAKKGMRGELVYPTPYLLQSKPALLGYYRLLLWTIINVAELSPAIWQQETPTTTELFYLEGIADVNSSEHSRFREFLISELGI